MEINIGQVVEQDRMKILTGNETTYGANSRYIGLLERRIYGHLASLGIEHVALNMSPDCITSVYNRAEKWIFVNTRLRKEPRQTSVNVGGPDNVLLRLRGYLVEDGFSMEDFSV